MLKFTFNNKNSYDDYGIIITESPTFPSPKRKVTTVDIPGRSSALRYDENAYEDIIISLDCAVKEDTDLPDKIDQIKGWLIGSGESELIFSNQPDKKYTAQVVNSIDFKETFNVLSEFPIIFNCRPFKYKVDEPLITVTSSNIILKNEGTFQSQPIIKIYGSGDLSITINGEAISIKNVSQYVTVDSVSMDCYKDDILKNCDMTGDFPVFNCGDNMISFSGGVTKIEVQVNTVWI